jgi:UDP-N-acetylmuramyl pentapeptide phosphotransferase/UDP-N-acetylglucosamine-1-phosphate transferase
MINAFNLIDGIDGLAGIIAVISFAAFAVVFWLLDYKGYFGVCFLMIGIILSYLPFNFSTKRKVFMGDSGSMFIGYILFVMTTLVVNTNAPLVDNLLFNRAVLPIAPLVIFIIPIIDSASIYLYRLSIGRSPFSADKFHLHHLFLLYTNSHLVSTLSISSLYIFVIVLFSLMVFSSTTVFFISAYFVLIFALILVSNIVRIKSKEKLAKL